MPTTPLVPLAYLSSSLTCLFSESTLCNLLMSAPHKDFFNMTTTLDRPKNNYSFDSSYDPSPVSYDLYTYLKQSLDLEELRGKPEALLSTFDLFYSSQDEGYKSGIKLFKEHYTDILKLFYEESPEVIVQLSSAEDFGYSAIFLSQVYSKLNKNFKFYTLITTKNKSVRDIELTKYLIELSGIENIHAIVDSSLTVCATEIPELENGDNIDFVIVNHEKNSATQDVNNLRVAESLGMVLPGTYVTRVNFEETQEDKINNHFQKYLNGAPNFRQKYNAMFDYAEHDLLRHPGRWNMVYSSTPTCKNCLKCTDYLDA